MLGKKFTVSKIVWSAPVILIALLAFAFFQTNRSGLVAAKADAPLVASVEGGVVGSEVKPISVVLDSLPKVDPASIKPAQVPIRRGVSEAEYAARKQAALTRGITPSPFETPMGDPLVPGGQLLTPFPHLTFAGIGATGWSPSDMAIAVGHNYVVQVVNESIAVYSKTGVIQAGYPKSLQTFTGCGCSNSLFDPRAFFDWAQSRYVVLFARDNGAASSTFYVAASQTNDPRGAWWIYSFTYGAAGDFGDFPTLGYDHQGIYTCASTFNPGFSNNKCFLIPKITVYSGGGVVPYIVSGFSVGGTPVDAIQPVKTMEYDKPRVEFMVNSFNIAFGGGQCSTGCSGVVVWAIANPFGFLAGGPSPVFSGTVVGTSTYILSPNATAPGCANCVDSNDTRISFQPTYHAGSIYAAVVTGVGSPAHPGIRWWEIGASLNDNGDGHCTGAYSNLCPTLNGGTLRQEGLYWYSGGDAYFPAIQPDDQNNIIMTFAYSNSTYVPGAVNTGRRVDMPLNTFHDTGMFIATGSGSVTGNIRWGDYFATALDMNYRPWRMWSAGMINAGTNSWATVLNSASYYWPQYP